MKYVFKGLPEEIIPFEKAINSNRDLSKTFVCFYSPDKTFERVRKNPRKYLAFFKKTAGIIGLDFSVHSDMPIIKQKAQMNDNMSLTYFFAKEGIPVIPNLRCGSDELLPEFLSAFPKRTYVAVGVHGFCKETREKSEVFCFLDHIIRELEPKTIIVYGSLKSHLFDGIKKRSHIVEYPAWISTRMEEIHKDINKR